MPIDLPGNSDEIQEQNQNLATHDELWYNMMTDCMRILAYQNNRKIHFTTVRSQVIISKDVATTVDLIDLAQELLIEGNVRGDERLRSMITGLVRYITNVRLPQLPAVDTFDEYLAFNSFEISDLMADIINNISSEQASETISIFPGDDIEGFPDGIDLPATDTTEFSISTSNLFPEGFWELDHVIESFTGDCDTYHFLLEVSDEEDYSNIVISEDTRNSSDNWTIEIKEDVFGSLSEYLSSNGLSDKFVNNRLRYASPASQYLSRGQIYYYRVYQITDDDVFGPTEFEDIIYT